MTAVSGPQRGGPQTTRAHVGASRALALVLIGGVATWALLVLLVYLLVSLAR
jgi:hypothetical protein